MPHRAELRLQCGIAQSRLSRCVAYPGVGKKIFDLNFTLGGIARKKSLSALQKPLKGQSHEKFGEMRARGLSLGHN
jgi:hypothetical protein